MCHASGIHAAACEMTILTPPPSPTVDTWAPSPEALRHGCLGGCHCGNIHVRLGLRSRRRAIRFGHVLARSAEAIIRAWSRTPPGHFEGAGE